MRGLGIIANLAHIVLAAGFVAAYSRPPLLLYGSAVILVVAFATRFLPIVHQTALRWSAPSTCRWSSQRAISAPQDSPHVHGEVPLARRGLHGAWILIFLAAARALSTAVSLVTPDTEVANTYIYSLANGGKYETVATVGVITVVFTITIVTIADRMVGSTRAFAKEQAR